jgi:uncharacterized protein YjbJ (UPF0337 family)
VERAELLVSEVVSNSVRHAGLDPDDRIEVQMQGSPSMLRVDVIDPGSGFEPATRRPGLHGGWGVWLLDRLATRWGVERNGHTRVWFEIRPAVSVQPGPGSDMTTDHHRGGAPMGEKTDKAKGHVKEAVGDMTDDERLEREGKMDRASGELKGKAEDAKDRFGEGVDAAKEKMSGDD